MTESQVLLVVCGHKGSTCSEKKKQLETLNGFFLSKIKHGRISKQTSVAVF